MDVREHLRSALATALTVVGVDSIPHEISLERPANPEHGDWSSNVALATAKSAGRNPRELGQQLVDHLRDRPPAHVTAIEIAGPGFVNFHLADTWLHDVLVDVVEAGIDGFARPDLGQGLHVNVEFVSANPNKPLHAGHGRGACYGDSIARLRERCGYRVTREYYINDRGVQMTKYAESLAARKRGEEPPDDGYKGEYLIEWAAEMPADADPLEWGYERALASHRATLESLAIHHDVWFSERSMVASGAIDETLADLRAHDAVYEAEGATWLRSTDQGDDKDRVLIKSDGDLTYLTPDIAYHRDKFLRSDRLFNVWGADHHGYVPRMKAAMYLLGHDPEELHIAITQMVDLKRGGEEVAMSGRSGEFVSIDDVVGEVGADAARFTYLMQSVDSRQTFDLDEVATQGMENPVFYVQYAHARICSIMTKTAEAGVARRPLAEVDLSLLTHERELEVLRSLQQLPDIVEIACLDDAPHRIAGWSREQAAALHGFYHDCYVMGDGVSDELTQARLALVAASQIGLRIALDLLGVSAPESM
ncbi:MAG: arginine--tRNA ligase [Acidimicrobiales bacterium]